MLEIKGLTKIYRSKTGEEVRALDGVDISFPETGMVFILGKSGSGKSTLLNIMGGLDSYDSGEFSIKGKSSADFAGSDFDAYRNTFIGFIFQEYNVLDDFTVGANIALALELQGKKASPEAIGSILAQVDLTTFAKRKPNELSGGQKQRVAIARALVKDPQIIMADEPTGALDSNTGKQIFDTLKKLSETKLVLVVSHDRDFAERYADRIVELADGRIISDVTKHERQSEKVSEGIEKIGGQILRIKAGYTLTAEDLKMINAYLAQNKADVLLSGDGRVNDELRSAAGISETGATAVFEETDARSDYTLKKYEKKDSRFIRSRLPIKNAMHMGASGLKHKKFRLAMTVFLSLIAFALFGFADTLGAYQKLNATVNSLMDSNVKNASVTLGVRYTQTYVDGNTYTYHESATLNDSDIAYLREQTGLSFVPVFTGEWGGGYNYGFSVTGSMKNYSGNSAVYTGKLHGLVAMTREQLIDTTGFTVTGRLPETAGEIAVTELLYRQFNEYGFENDAENEKVDAGKLTMTDDGSSSSIIGKHITLKRNMGSDLVLKVVGVVDTGFNYERYGNFLPEDENARPNEEESNVLSDMVLQMEIESEVGYGFHGLGFAHADDIKTLSEFSYFGSKELGTYMDAWSKSMHVLVSGAYKNEMGEDNSYAQTIHQVAGSDILDSLKITWFGEEKTTLGENEIVLPSRLIENLFPRNAEIMLDLAALDALAAEKYGSTVWEDAKSESNTVYDALRTAAYEKYNADPNPETRMQEDFFSYFLGAFGLSLPETGMDVTEDLYYELYNAFQSATFSEPKLTVASYQIENVLRLVYADLAVSKHALHKNDAFMALVENHFGGKLDGTQTDEYLKRLATQYYADTYLSDTSLGYAVNRYGKTGGEIQGLAKDTLIKASGATYADILKGLSFERIENDHENGNEVSIGNIAFTVVGMYDSTSYLYSDMIISDSFLTTFKAWRLDNMGDYAYTEDRAEHVSGIWAYALAPLFKDRDVIHTLVTMSYDESADLRFELQNPVMDTLGAFNDFIEIGSQVFLYVGLGFALFSALLLMNFIATSISYKKRDIGVLRAVGARSSDVFKIFFSEALMIALINFVLSTVVVIAGIIVANTLMHAEGITVTLLSYGARQFFLMLAISVGVALLASFLPVYNIAKKKPVNAIKDR